MTEVLLCWRERRTKQSNVDWLETRRLSHPVVGNISHRVSGRISANGAIGLYRHATYLRPLCVRLFRKLLLRIQLFRIKTPLFT